MLSRILARVAPLLLAGACTTFGSVRSAEVVRGPSLALQATLSIPPDGWSATSDCATDCGLLMPGGDASVTLGTAAGSTPVSVGAGISGVIPYLEGYAQLNRAGENPWGVGTRVGIPVAPWTEYQLFARFDRPLDGERRLLLTPALYLHTGHARDDRERPTLLAFSQGVGLMYRRADYSVTPSVSLIAGRGERPGSTGQNERYTTVFGTASINVVFHNRRTR